MTATLATTALLMGIAGAPHCAAMCGAACGGLTSAARSPRSRWLFQGGRLAGYAAAGALAAGAVQAFGALTQATALLRPAWTLFHLVVLAWALSLVVLARQPVWVSSAGRSAWTRIRPMAQRSGGLFTAGALWIFLPCGLLWSALLVASLSGGPLEGAVSMALFGAASSTGLLFGPWLFARLKQAGNKLRQDWGTRAAGLLLAGAAGWALWMDLAHRIALWCA
ncbi:sulfite exporter TauE/SafE family protein [Ramlibacter tataouinensis]|uniref:sulfite exporter TauE/SafE family protein n=1 Tax=Ramlibacter tataouinensis TaxID=94132 RepID=UPI0022F3E665|nr:sulfite exporter TauE/SafE family protein [Ramlibacter tataouinensis]WBY03938.1 sulfite exporter TauE/SafE family protein [Ramlibacter tataouinensis]